MTRQARARAPGDLQFAGRLNRLPRLLRNNAHEIFLHHHLHRAGQTLHRAFIHIDDCRAHDGRPHHAPVEHARQAHVMHKLKLSGDERGQIRTPRRSPQHRPFACGLPFNIGIELDLELLSADQFAITHFFRGVALRADHAVCRDKLVCGYAEPLRSQFEKRLARRGCGLRQILLVEVGGMRLAAGRNPLVRRNRRVAISQVDAIKGHAQLFRHQLDLRRRNALPQFCLARECRHATICRNGNPRIELVERRRTGRAALERSLGRSRLQRAFHAEADDERSGAHEKRPARESRTPQRGCRVIGQSRLWQNF